MRLKIVGGVPAYNNESTIGQAVASLFAQTIPLADVFVVDDGSTDKTAAAAEKAGARVVSMGSNQGRGAARARCVEEAGDANILVSVDGTAALDPDFVAKALPWLKDPKTAAVYGRIDQPPARTAADRWRGRHLYRLGERHVAGPAGSFISWGFALRTDAAREVGNFSAAHRHSEDLEFGERLLASGWGIWYEPAARVTTLVSNTTAQVLERWRRWNGLIDRERPMRWRDRRKFLFMLLRADLRDRDWGSAAISFRVALRQ